MNLKEYIVFSLKLFIRRTILIWLFIATLILIFLWSATSRTYVSEVHMLVWWTNGFPGIEEMIYCPKNIKCEVKPRTSLRETDIVRAYLFYGSNIDFKHLPLPRNQGVIWALYHEESPRNNPQLMHEAVLNLFNFSSTFSRDSDVPFPLQYLENFADITDTEYFVRTKEKNKLLRYISPMLYLQSDCDTATQRDQYVEQLMKYISVDSYGECLNNKVLPSEFKVDYLNKFNEKSFLQFIARYKFVIAIENGVCRDYVTEKFWRAVKVGTVPIYFGSPTIGDWLPNNKSAVLIEDHPSMVQMTLHLEKLLKNDTLYEEHLEHKIRGRISNARLKQHYELHPEQSDSLSTVREFQCLVCEALHKTSSTVKIIDKHHYECPKPVAASSLKSDHGNQWVYVWETAARDADATIERIKTSV